MLDRIYLRANAGGWLVISQLQRRSLTGLCAQYVALFRTLRIGPSILGPLYQSEFVSESESARSNPVWAAGAIVVTRACAFAGIGAWRHIMGLPECCGPRRRDHRSLLFRSRLDSPTLALFSSCSRPLARALILCSSIYFMYRYGLLNLRRARRLWLTAAISFEPSMSLMERGWLTVGWTPSRRASCLSRCAQSLRLAP